jgi:SAM-dependent methyltransferase
MSLLSLNFDWKLMAKVQDMLAVVDGGKSCFVHNLAGRIVGSIPRPYNPMPAISSSVRMLKLIKDYGGGGVTNKTFLEYGTGWVPALPIGLWLGGAGKVITIDANPYMQNKYVKESLAIIVGKQAEIKEMYGDLLDGKRLDALVKYAGGNKVKKKELLELCRIEYIAPGDAARTGLADESVDFHVSHYAFEHIPPEILKDILTEGGRIIKPNGLFINTVDYQDHFAVYTKTISQLNFLQYSDEEWRKYNNNKYVYVNRLRHDDFIKLFAELGHNIVYVDATEDENIKKLLETGEVLLDKKFRDKPLGTLAIMGAWFLTKPRRCAPPTN